MISLDPDKGIRAKIVGLDRSFSMEEIGSSLCPRSFNGSRVIVSKNYIMETARARGRGAIKVRVRRGSSVEISISVERGASDAET